MIAEVASGSQKIIGFVPYLSRKKPPPTFEQAIPPRENEDDGSAPTREKPRRDTGRNPHLAKASRCQYSLWRANFAKPPGY